jgi:hypothetical protein
MNSLKTINTLIWGTYTLWDWGRWILIGTTNNEELTLAKQNKQRMDRIEDKLDQILAIEMGLPPVEMGESFIVVDSKRTEKK